MTSSGVSPVDGRTAAVLVAAVGFGSACVAAGSWSWGVLPRPLGAAALGAWQYGHGDQTIRMVLILGLFLVLAAWGGLGRLALDGRVSVGTLWAATAAMAVPMIVSLPTFSADGYVYLSQADLLNHGLDPYTSSPSTHPGPLLQSTAEEWQATTSPYGPAFVLLIAGVTRLTGDSVLFGLVGIRLAMLGGLALAAWCAPRLARAVGTDPRVATWLTVANPMLVLHLLGGPHNELLLIGPLAAGLLAALRGRPLVAAALIGLAAAVKIIAAVALPFLVWIWLRRRAASPPLTFVGTAAATGAVALAVVAVFSLPFDSPLGWISGVGSVGLATNLINIPTAAAHVVIIIAAPWHGFAMWPVLVVTRAVGTVVLAATLVVIWWRARVDVPRAAAGAAWALLAACLLGPTAYPWYFAWFLALAPAVRLDRLIGPLVVFAGWVLWAFEPNSALRMYDVRQFLFGLLLGGLTLLVVRSEPASYRSPWSTVATIISSAHPTGARYDAGPVRP